MKKQITAVAVVLAGIAAYLVHIHQSPPSPPPPGASATNDLKASFTVRGSHTGTGCPGSYKGYCGFTNSAAGNISGFYVYDTNASTHLIIDTNNFNTRVEADGFNGDVFCDSNSVSFDSPPLGSTLFKFTVYFKNTNNIPTSNNYWIRTVGLKIP